MALGLSAKVVRPLAVLGISKPTPIQSQAIPLVLAGHDVMGLAQTGTGKTAAFGLPLVDRLLQDHERPAQKTARCLVLAPTRELVNQIADNLRTYVKKTPVWVSSVVGGQSINPQIKHLLRGTDILVATPGRLLDLVDRGAVRLDAAQYLVLDEADQMLDLGFIHDLRKIAKLLGSPRQTLLFSATMPKTVAELSKNYLTDPKRVEVAPPGKAADKVSQSVYFVQTKGKADLLKTMLAERENDLSLVFARTKHGAEKLMKVLVASGFAAASIHGNKSQGQRDRALKAFKTGEVRILVATDVAARGIDIPDVTHVYNYNLPEVPENYVHRIGRTARAGRAGAAIAFCSPEERKLLRQIERVMDIEIDIAGSDGSENEYAPPVARKRGGSAGHVNADGTPKKKRRSRQAEQNQRGRAAQPHKKHPRRNKSAQGSQSAARGEPMPTDVGGAPDQASTRSDRPTGSKQNRSRNSSRSGKPRTDKPGQSKSGPRKPRGGKGQRPSSGGPNSGRPNTRRPGRKPSR
ncbi:MAG: DEAD/DEAH box helicase [Rhizobiaceae bacterium]